MALALRSSNFTALLWCEEPAAAFFISSSIVSSSVSEAMVGTFSGQQKELAKWG
jgi:hypothetical protein